MEGSQLLDLLQRQTFEACIGGMSNELEMSQTLANCVKFSDRCPASYNTPSEEWKS
jgi:hypothetical protein